MPFSREYQNELMSRLTEYGGMSESTILHEVLDYLDSVEACEALEYIAAQYDLLELYDEEGEYE